MAWNFLDLSEIRQSRQPQQMQQSQQQFTHPPEPSKRPVVCICIPHTGSWNAEWVEKTYTPLKCIPTPYFDKIINLSRGSPVDVARNQFAKAVLEDKRITHLFFVDSDIIPEIPPDPNEMIFRLLSCNVPIVTGLYRARKKEGFSYAIWMEAGNEQFVPVEQWTGNFFRVDVCGAGCLLIRRDVLEKVPPPWFVWDDMKASPSEDFMFTLKCRKYGFETWCFSEVRCSHISGQLKVMSDGRVVTCEV